MAQPGGADGRVVDARIVYWGIEGAGTSTNLQGIHAKLRPDHRGRLEQVPTRLDPSVSYERLPIELGEIAGVRTRIQIVAVPGGPEHAPTRKALLDRVDGLVFVVDARREKIDANVAALEELRSALAAYGRSLEDVPLVVQYNKQDLSDAFVLEELHRKLDVRGAAAFEAVAAEGSGVLQTLTTISKRVVRTLRETREAAGAAPAARPAPAAAPAIAHPAPAPAAPPRPAPAPLARPAPPRLPDLEEAALAADELDDRDEAVSRAAGLLDASWPDVAAGYPLETDDGISPGPLERGAQGRFGLEITAPHGAPAGDWRIVAAGAAEPHGPRGLVVPVVLADAEGRELRLRLSLALELLPED
jgi:signal recognition particle receptor subunit beta